VFGAFSCFLLFFSCFFGENWTATSRRKYLTQGDNKTSTFRCIVPARARFLLEPLEVAAPQITARLNCCDGNWKWPRSLLRYRDARAHTSVHKLWEECILAVLGLALLHSGTAGLGPPLTLNGIEVVVCRTRMNQQTLPCTPEPYILSTTWYFSISDRSNGSELWSISPSRNSCRDCYTSICSRRT